MKSLKFGKRHNKSTDSRSSTKPKHDEHKEIHVKPHHNSNVEKDKEKNLESSQRNATYYLQGNNNLKYCRFLVKSHAVQREVAQHFSSAKRTEWSRQQFIQ